jgi:hypothetical protein
MSDTWAEDVWEDATDVSKPWWLTSCKVCGYAGCDCEGEILIAEYDHEGDA